MTDWYDTKSAKKVGFTARPVVGGVFMQMLQKPKLWQKWAGRDRTNAGNYAPMPRPAKVALLFGAADSAPAIWRFTTKRPDGKWNEPNFDDAAWQQGPAGFGTENTPGARVGTTWNSPDIWLRRTFDLPQEVDQSLRLHIHHDEDAEIYINGVLARRVAGFTTDYRRLRIDPAALKTLTSKGNTLAVHCHQTGGGQYIDVGFATIDSDLE
jgi:Domain of unknown function (DUF1793)